MQSNISVISDIIDVRSSFKKIFILEAVYLCKENLVKSKQLFRQEELLSKIKYILIGLIQLHCYPHINILYSTFMSTLKYMDFIFVQRTHS